MKTNKKRKGIWIPIEMIENKELDWTNKALLSEIYSLHEQEKGCIASDQHFANLLGFKHPSTAQKRVDSLVEMKLVRKKVITKNGRTVGKILTPLEPISSIGKITSQKSKSTGQEEQINSSDENNGIVPGQPESSSPESNGVVPGSHDSSSPENTNNTKKNTIRKNTINNTTGSIQEVDQIVANSSSISKHLFNSAEAINEFENSLLDFLNENNYSYSMIFYLLKDYLKILGNWEERLIKSGIEEFIHDLGNYHKGDPNEIAFVYALAIRTLNYEQSD